jgi:hypothetical protein
MNKKLLSINKLQVEQLKNHNEFIEDIALNSENPIFNILLITTNQFAEAYKIFLEIMEMEQEKANYFLIELYQLVGDREKNMKEKEMFLTNVFEAFRWYMPFNEFYTLGKILNDKNLILQYFSTHYENKADEVADFEEAVYLYIDKMIVWTSAINVIATKLKASINLKKSRKQHSIDIHKKGGIAKKAISEMKQKKAYELYEKGRYHSYAECARKIYQEVGVKDPRTVAIWLSKKYSKK